MSMFLTGEELTDLTGKKRKRAQSIALRQMGIDHIVRPDGVPIVVRSYFETVLDGKSKRSLESKQEIEPNWDAV